MVVARLCIPIAAAVLAASYSTLARAHHEALFGPQSSLAIESDGFVSLQTHVRLRGSGDSLSRETTSIVSGGIAPIAGVPWVVTLVQPFTYENARGAPGNQTGAFSGCTGCLTRENLLLNTSYRFMFTGLQRVTGKDGNFALVSASVEPPTGAKDYAPFHGPPNFIAAAMTGVEWSSFSTVALGYYRINVADGTGSKKGNNFLVALGFTFTPIDEARMLSFQMGLAAEVHDRDVLAGAPIDQSGGWEIFASPTLVWGAAQSWRYFVYASLPVVQDYRSVAQEDRWRAGIGMIYSFDRGPALAVGPSQGHQH